MVIERTKDEIIIRIPAEDDVEGLQEFINYLSYREATSKSKATQEDVDALAKEAKSSWWADNKHRFNK